MQNYRHEFIAPNEKWDILLEFMIDPGGSVINKHFHDWIEIVYLIHGDLEFQDNNRRRKLKENEGYIFRCYSLIFELIYILIHSFSYKADRKELQQTQRNMERIQIIMDYVQQHYSEHISIKEIAGEVGLNEIYFSRFFKAHMNQTFLEYLNMVRLEKIYIDLLNTDRSIKNLQEEHGFYNDKVFRRMFREVYGGSPREVRNHMKY